ncbi:hypothetical protein Pla110_40610 [Polystyrenella longa]|uniref:WGR domain-containing protein n=1 Tax=Polystyrenella longa TaxID=2528007 RepID=A0A518CSW0_9PLAN|nr:HEAT repeat domain-containing protein [Polystyrenella longa]QDU82306.1 hypothetical protein Pla110_40610 [Polystyrenella longa]
MKLHKQVILEFREGNSDEIYEIDLCEIGPDQFVVNFRHGHRGTTLSEGTNTDEPLSFSDAELMFEELVTSKTTKGYRETTHTAIAPLSEQEAEAQVTKAASQLTAREQAILNRLSRDKDTNHSWKLSRAVWRAGEFRLHEAEPVLISLLGSGDPMLDYAVAWSLGRLGGTASRAALSLFIDDENNAPHARRIATVALAQILTGEEQRGFLEQQLHGLPDNLLKSALDGPIELFEKDLREFRNESDKQTALVMESLYLLNNEFVRPVLLTWLQSAEFKHDLFQALRHIFKAAELRCDAEVFGILAYRFETTKSGRDRFRKESKFYFRRRIWWTLKRMAELEQPEFVPMAAHLLRQYTDGDAVPERKKYTYVPIPKTYRYQSITVRYGPYAPYLALNQLLYGNSPRFELDKARRYFCFQKEYQGNDGLLNNVREEAFPELWEQQPQVVFEMLTVSCCEKVHHFGVHVLRDCPSFCNEMESSSLISLLETPYTVTNHYALELARPRYDADSPDLDLLTALANCSYDEAQKQAWEWITPVRETLFANSDFAVALLASPQPQTRQHARQVLREVDLSTTVRREILKQIFSRLYKLDEIDSRLAAELSQMLLENFEKDLQRVNLDVLLYLAAHRVPELRRFAGELILLHDTFRQAPPVDVLVALLSSKQEIVVDVGIQIFLQLSPEVLKENEEIVFQLIRHPQEKIRELMRPTLIELAQSDSLFGHQISVRLVEALLISGASEGVPTYTMQLLCSDLRGFLNDVPSRQVWQLLNSKSGPAQQLGAELLETNVDSIELSVYDLVVLADHDLIDVRQIARQWCRKDVDKIRKDLPAAIKLFDTRWDDSRQFAFQYFRENVVESELLSPDMQIAICDSTRPDVQQFGRELITRAFDEEHAEEYLIKLSEHPSGDMQLFASSLLGQYEGDDGEHLRRLSYFFASVLSRVNRGRVVKNRVYRFLEQEASKSEANAQVVIDLLNRQSATAAIGDKSRAIEILLAIHARYPTLPTILQLQPVEVRNGV